MNLYVIVDVTTGKYVAQPGSVHSFTDRLEEAHTFASADDARRHLCVESECVAHLSSLLHVPQSYPR